MSESQSVEPRRTSPASAGTSRELPVLFHLMDVSRLKTPTAAPLPPAPIFEPAETTTFVPEPEPAASTAPAIQAAASIESKPEPPSSEIAAECPPAEPVLKSTETNAVETASPTNAVSETNETGPSLQSESPQPAVSADAPAVAKREKAPKRLQRPKAQRGHDWFAHQGRYIAIGFVLALIGTIYLARSNRGGARTVETQPHAHPGEAGQQVAATETKSATVVGEAAQEDALESTQAAESSPAKLASDSPVEPPPQADLHPPTIPQLVHEPAPTKQPDNKALFPWTEQPSERVATRPDAPALSPQSPPTQYPVTAASAPLPPSYPVTSTPDSGFAAPPQQPPANQPDYRSPYVPAAPPGGAQPNLGQSFVPPTGGPGPTYLPSDNTARGYRYERTGSGPY